MNLLKKFVRFLAGEPVVVIAGALQSALMWLFTYVITDWSPSEHSLDLAGLATGAAFLVSMVARQFVEPVEKIAKYIDPDGTAVDPPSSEPKSLADPAIAEDAK